MAITVYKVGMDNCQPCKDVDGYLQELSKEFEFDFVSYNVSPDSEGKQRRDGKKMLMKYGTIKVPLLVFNNGDKDFAAIYKEEAGENTELYLTKAKEILNGNK